MVRVNAINSILYRTASVPRYAEIASILIFNAMMEIQTMVMAALLSACLRVDIAVQRLMERLTVSIREK